jgi:hypothetical protein
MSLYHASHLPEEPPLVILPKMKDAATEALEDKFSSPGKPDSALVEPGLDLSNISEIRIVIYKFCLLSAITQIFHL